ncbi:MAG: energy transducer TonB [Lysobacter sp.]
MAPGRVDADDGDLGRRARRAMADSRVHSPAGDNAIDLYLALRDRHPDDPRAAAALAELSPYMVIATEQAIGQGDVYEAERLLALLLRMDAEAPAASRLREALRSLHRVRQAEMVRAVGDPSAVATAVAASPSATPSRAAPPPEASSPKVETARRLAVEASAPIAPQAKPKPATPKPPPVPRLLRDATPDYPLHALRRGIEGRVRVAFTIEADGSVSAARPVASTPQGVFDDAAVAAARRWRFEPGAGVVSTSRVLNFSLPGR